MIFFRGVPDRTENFASALSVYNCHQKMAKLFHLLPVWACLAKNLRFTAGNFIDDASLALAYGVISFLMPVV